MTTKHPNQINIVLTPDEVAWLETVQKAQSFDVPRQRIARSIFTKALEKEAAKVGRRRAG